MGEDASRFRQRAKVCRELARRTQFPDVARTLDETGDDLEKEADRLDDEERAASPRDDIRDSH